MNDIQLARVNHVNRDATDPTREVIDATPPGDWAKHDGVRRVNFCAPAGQFRVNDVVRITVERVTLDDVAEEWGVRLDGNLEKRDA